MDSVSSPVLGFFEPPQIDKQTLNKALLYVLEQSGDDLVLVTGYPMAMIKAERIVYIGTRNLYYDELRELIEMITDSKNAAMELQQQNDLDPTYVIQIERGKTLRFRVNATGCLGRNGSTGMSIVMRPMSKIPPTMAELGVPHAIQQACMPKSGLVLIKGPIEGALIQITSGVADVIQWSQEIAKRITVENRRCGISDFVQLARAVMQKVLDRLDSAAEAPATSVKGPKLG